MIKLKNLKFKNIGRFVEQQEISFDNLGNLVQVDAQNNLTGGSSGSGKSTVFNALDWLLGLSDLSTAVLQSRLTKEPISVEGLFDWDGLEVRIHRSRKLSVTINGVETVGSSKLGEEKIDEILGMPRHLFRQILHKRQGDQGFFLAQTPAQMNAFLTDCLNLGPIRSKIDVIDLKIKDLAQSKDRFQSELQAAQAGLEANLRALQAIGEEPTTTATQTIIEGWRNQYESSQETLKALQATIYKEKGEFHLTRPKTMEIVPYDRTRYNAIENEIKEVNAKIEAENEQERARQKLVNEKISEVKLECFNESAKFKSEYNLQVAETKATLAKLNNTVLEGKRARALAVHLAEQIKVLRSGLCHTCNQSWILDEAKIEEQKLLQELTKHKVDIEASTKAASEIEELTVSLKTVTDEVNAKVAEISSKYEFSLSTLTEDAKPKKSANLHELQVKLLALQASKKEEFAKEDDYNVAQNARTKKLLEAWFVEESILEQKYQKALAQVNQEVAESRSQFERSVSEFKNHEINLAKHKQVFKNLTEAQHEMNSKVVDINSKLVDTTEKLEVAEEAKRCLKSYLSCSFDDALDSISESATRILRAVPTMANATVRLIGTKESANGSIKDQVTAILDNDGFLEVPIKSLSGGERSAVDLAIDMSVLRLVEERACQGINLYIMDEPFQFLDTVNIEQIVEMIKQLDTSKTIIIVDHNPIVKEMVSEKIMVLREEEQSRIQI